MPDLFQYLLTGVKRSEKSIANTSNLMGTEGQWCSEIIERFSLPKDMFAELIEPATVLGPLQDDVRNQTGLGEVPVIATCGHDTSGAVAAVPGEGEGWAFLSCGTWSILGSLIDQPVATPRSLELGFTNEYTIGGWYIARNISGLWLVQELRRKWDTAEDPWDYVRMTREAAEADCTTLINAADDSLLAPPDMEESLLGLAKQSGGSMPESKAQLVRCVLESLALEYDLRISLLEEVLSHRPSAIYMVGGGIHNKLLCQLTANACQLPVYAGADQCTAMGNALGQALGLGVLHSRDEIRQVMRDSFEVTLYEPAGRSEWDDKRARYRELVSR
jgi:rhamnulokinase